MSRGKNKGYTIVEVMIVLAISGFMFLIAVVFIGGKQAAAQFTQGANDMTSRLQATIQEASDGQFPSGNFTCVTTADPLTFPSGGSATQGTHDDCVFLGKVVNFEDNATLPQKYDVFTVAGRQNNSTGTVTALLDPLHPTDAAWPTAIYSPVDLTDTQTVPQNLKVTAMTVKDSASNSWKPTHYAIGFLTNPAVGSTGGLTSGAQSVGLYYLDTGAFMDKTAAGPQIRDTHLLSASKACITITDDTRTATIVVGDNNNVLGVTLDRAGTAVCS